jgi:hypothetical protein
MRPRRGETAGPGEVSSEVIIANVLVQTLLDLGIAYSGPFRDADDGSESPVNSNSLLEQTAHCFSRPIDRESVIV